jgi:hypothetical protein
MTDNLRYAWRTTPLEDIMPTSRLIDDLERAGYTTAGDVLDVDAETLAADVYGIGPIRAIKMRQRVFDHVKPFGSFEAPNWVMHEGPIVREIEAPPSRNYDAVFGFIMVVVAALALWAATLVMS